MKTINGNSILGNGDLSVGGGLLTVTMDDILNGTTYVKTENNYTDAEASKLAGIEAGAKVNVNADWNAVSGDAQILNKPSIPTQYTDEMAQDAVGAMVANSTFVNLTYVDGTPSLTPSLSATGTPSASTYLRGDNTWAAVSGGTITSAEGAASADVTMAATNTWYTGATVNLTAGTWLINAHITLNRTTTTAQQYQVRIHNTTDNVSYASSQQYQASVANAAVSMSLTAIITIAATKDVAIQAASSVSTNNLIKAATLANGSGNNATKITAIKLA